MTRKCDTESTAEALTLGVCVHQRIFGDQKREHSKRKAMEHIWCEEGVEDGVGWGGYGRTGRKERVGRNNPH